jgi:hypothetical protein
MVSRAEATPVDAAVAESLLSLTHLIYFCFFSLSKSDTEGISITRVKAARSFKKGALIGFLYVQNQLLLMRIRAAAQLLTPAAHSRRSASQCVCAAAVR